MKCRRICGFSYKIIIANRIETTNTINQPRGGHKFGENRTHNRVGLILFTSWKKIRIRKTIPFNQIFITVFPSRQKNRCKCSQIDLKFSVFFAHLICPGQLLVFLYTVADGTERILPLNCLL